MDEIESFIDHVEHEAPVLTQHTELPQLKYKLLHFKDKIERKKQQVKKIFEPLKQVCTTNGPWAKCGSRTLFIFPAQPNFVFFFPFLFDKNTVWEVQKEIFGPP